MKKIAFVISIMITLLIVPIDTYAEDTLNTATAETGETISISVEDCMNMAVAYSHQVTVIEQQMEALWKQQNELMEMSNGIQQQLDILDTYKRLYEKKQNGTTLTIDEHYELLGYQYAFGPKPPVYSQQELFEKFIKNRDFPHYSAWGAFKNLKTNREVLAASIKIGVKQLFDGIIDMQDAILLQEELHVNMCKQNEQMLVKYNQGLISEINKYLSDCSLEKQRLAIQKLKRSLNNMMMSLKQQIGVSLKQDVVLQYDDEKKIKTTKSYPALLREALANRSEVLTAKMDLQVKQREDDIIKQYISNELLSERMESSMSLEEKRIVYDEAINDVTADIYSGYHDVKLKQHDYSIALAKHKNAERQYKEASLKYEKGLINLSELWNVEISKVQARLGCNKAIRDNNNAVYKLEVASGIGPGYSPASGGY